MLVIRDQRGQAKTESGLSVRPATSSEGAGRRVPEAWDLKCWLILTLLPQLALEVKRLV